MKDIKVKFNRNRKIGAVFFCLAGVILVGFLLRNSVLDTVSEIRYRIHKNIPEITVDFDDPSGSMKLLHGINNGPKSGYSDSGQWKLDMSDVYSTAGIPIVRTHDTEYPYGQDQFVDIHCIFPDMDQNVDDPEAYHFDETDQYIDAIIESGAQVFFRLGESIDHSGEDRYINPPEDNRKWAQICEHIIRHYNEGWADGYHYNIVYWEIWNEPDNAREWTGSMEQYYELYRTAARYLKEIFPEIKIGGCAMADPEGDNVLRFLESLTEDGEDTPLDFFSWHRYTNDPSSYRSQAEEIRKTLDSNGYKNTESVLDEWNYVENWNDLSSTAEVIHSVKGSSFIAATLITLQNSPVDLAMYYDSQYALADIWCGLYDGNGNREPGYNAFYYFNQLCQLGQQVTVEGTADNLYCCAAAGEKKGLLLTNYDVKNDESIKIKLQLSTERQRVSITRINKQNPNGVTTEETWLRGHNILKIDASEVIYIEVL